MHQGYIALWRKIQEHPFYREKRKKTKLEAWIDILLNVQHKIEPQQVVLGVTLLVCNYGECIKSNRTWAERWNWSEPAVRRFLDLLKKMGQIDKKNEGKTTRIIVINFEQYDPKRRRRDADATHERRRRDADATTDKNDKNTNTPPTPPRGDKDGYSNEFENWWSYCPKKVGKDAAWRLWQKVVGINGTTPDLLVTALRKQLKVHHFRGRDGKQYYPKPANWLKDGCWKDDLADLSHTPTAALSREPQCGSCGIIASNVQKGQPCPFCGGPA